MITDIHAHLAYHKIYSQTFLDGIVDSIHTGVDRRFVNKILENALQDAKSEKLVRQMREAGITKTVLLIADYGYALGEPEYTIEEIHYLHSVVLKKYPAEFEVFAGIDPRRGESGVRLFEKSVAEYGFSGLKLYPPCGFELDAKELFPLYEICSQFRIPVLTHTGPSLGTMKTEQRFPQSILEVSRRYPDVDFIMAHGGARGFSQTIELALDRENIFFDISAFQVSMSDIDEFKGRFRMFFDKVPTKVLFGSDWPLYSLQGSQKKWVDCFRNLGVLSPEEQEMLFFRNAQVLLNKARNRVRSASLREG